MERFFELLDEGVNLRAGDLVGLERIGFFREKCVGDDEELAEAVIEHEEGVGENKSRVWDAEAVWRGSSEAGLELAHGVVGEEADEAADEGRELGAGNGFEVAHFVFERAENVALDGDFVGLFAEILAEHFAILGGIDAAWLGAEDGPASVFIRAFCAFEEEGVAEIAEFGEGGEGRFEVGGEGGDDGDDVS